MNSPLKWDVFVSSQISAVTPDLPPGATEMKWSPISATLISGERDAVLVDTFITMEQNRALVEWVAASGKNLTAIYATHGHGDHFFGVNTIQQRFPNARFLASPDAIEVMREQLSPSWLEAYWKSRFPGQIDPALAIAEALTGAVIQLEGNELVSIRAGIRILEIRLVSMSLRSAWSRRATSRITMFISTSANRVPIQGKSGSLRST
jgi:glyoxylase-like metal-dependent hydrolase (beta-lactamase superfamily II)